MFGKVVNLPRLKRNDILPYFFTEDEVLSIFAVCRNLKHLAMLQTLFYGCLRASELCNFDDADLDLKRSTIHIREGKGGRDGIAHLSPDCIRTLIKYLQVRPPFEIDERKPLFYTDYGQRWDRHDVYRMFIRYKESANIMRRGGLHTFSRHSTATVMVSRGCDIRIIKEILRHKDIRTTLRYAHVNDKVVREWYNKTLRLEI
ncbi:MAG: tyrosine-type recombinase/integrase [Methanotrichaceae archaeon]|nr:tyrosine-type recombinase/integrase [Methanotrichaceae archaeon]